MQLDLEREKSLAAIRSEERQRSLSEVAVILEKIRNFPLPNYEGVHTLVTSAADSRDQVTGLLWNLLARYTEGAAAGQTSATERKG